MVQDDIEQIVDIPPTMDNPDGGTETIEVPGPCDGLGGQWVVNRI